jgi:hypothetical protein
MASLKLSIDTTFDSCWFSLYSPFKQKNGGSQDLIFDFRRAWISRLSNEYLEEYEAMFETALTQ